MSLNVTMTSITAEWVGLLLNQLKAKFKKSLHTVSFLTFLIPSPASTFKVYQVHA